MALAFALTVPTVALLVRPAAQDELEYRRATLWVREGKVPGRDFWEHHLPLQWYLMAPAAGPATAPAGPALLRLRSAQALLLAGTGAALALLLRRRRVGAPGIAAVLALLASSVTFVSFAVEYRVDTPMNLFVVVALVLAERSLDRTGAAEKGLAAACGVAMALAVLSSQRAVAAAVPISFLYLLVRRDGRWGLRPPFLFAFAGAAAVAAAAAAALASAGALGPLILQNVRDNALYEQLAGARGDRLLGEVLSLPWSSRDLAFFALLALAILALLRRPLFRAGPDARLRLALLALAQLGFLASIRSPYPYQLQTFVLLTAGLAGLALREEGTGAPRGIPAGAAAGAVAAVALVAATLALTRGHTPILARIGGFQDHVTRTVERVTAPSEQVWDGCGLVASRPPAFERWFLPPMARRLTASGIFAPFDPASFAARPPAAVILDSRVLLYLREVEGLSDFLRRNYLPVERVVWIPAPNAILTPAGPARWTVLREGSYRVAASRSLAGHPWFTDPFAFPLLGAIRPDAFALDLEQLARQPSHPIVLSVDGRRLEPVPARIDLEAGQQLEASVAGPEAVAFFLVPARERVLFADPYPAIPLEPTPEVR